MNITLEQFKRFRIIELIDSMISDFEIYLENFTN